MKKEIELVLNFINKTKHYFDEKMFIIIANKLLKKEKLIGHIEIDFSIVDEKTIIDLNNKFMKNNKPTDVLSFPIKGKKDLSNSIGPLLLGEIVISYPQAKVQAGQREVKTEEEVEFLFVHGLKHLLGHHHKE